MISERCPEDTQVWRSQAAKDGWKTRREGKTPWRRFAEAIGHIDPVTARLFCCELVGLVACEVTTAYPHDLRPTLILWTARRYARGEATERERLGVRQVALALAVEVVPDSWPETRREHACYALCWLLEKRQYHMCFQVAHHIRALTEDEDAFEYWLAARAEELQVTF